LGGVYHVNWKIARCGVGGKFLAQPYFGTYQQYSDTIVAGRQQGPFDLGPGMPV
jgi:hypothetical protein